MDVRAARQEDCEGIGVVHVDAWRAAYRGDFPADYLDGLAAEERAEYWRSVLGRTTETGSRLIVAESKERVVGFACCGPANGVDGRGEVYVMNVHPSHWRDGVGSALLKSVSALLIRMELSDALLWTGEQNTRAQTFFLAHGWRLDGTGRDDQLHGLVIAEVRLSKQLA